MKTYEHTYVGIHNYVVLAINSGTTAVCYNSRQDMDNQSQFMTLEQAKAVKVELSKVYTDISYTIAKVKFELIDN